MLTAENIKTIVSSGEGYNAEFKIKLPSKIKEVTEEVCAFANAAGGTVLIGVDDYNVIKGASIGNEKRSAIQNSIQQITPALDCSVYSVNVDGYEVWVIETPSGNKKPYVLSGSIFVRSGPNTQKVTTVEKMRDFFQQSNRIYFDETPCKDFNPETDVDENTLQDFKTKANLSLSVPNEQIFTNLRLKDEKEVFKNGAVLFFGKNPEHLIETASLRCIAFDGLDKRFINDDKTFGGPLMKQYQSAINWLKKKLDVSYKIEGSTGPREEVWEIPQTVFKEAIINALAHRDYYDKGARINIEVFNNRVEIYNPGGLVSAISPKDFGKRSHSRNPLIFGLFSRMRMVEQIGSGISRMNSLMTEQDLPLPQFSYERMFSVTFIRKFDFNNWVNKWVNNLTINRANILKAINKNNKVTKRELEDIIGISSTALDNNLDVLKEIGILERKGTKGGTWIIHYITPKVGK
jgi:ATP-dependent DNA helicase RecG